MNFTEIFTEYYSMYRGQGTSIPVFGDREYTVAIPLANNAIRKWDRADGSLWRELFVRATDQTTVDWATADRTLVDGTVSYAAPTNMRKPPRKVFFYLSGDYFEVPVIEPEKMAGLSELSRAVSFLGGANTGYTMYITAALATQYAGRSIDYLYFKKPTMFTIATTPAAIVPEMSDPNFIIQDMLVTRHTQSKNGFGVKVADREAKIALVNMKIEQSSGVPGQSDNWGVANDWGVNRHNNDIQL